MMRSLLFLALMMGMVSLASCTKEEVEFAVSFEELMVTELCTPEDETLSEETFIIRSQEEYTARTACMVGAPEVDFSKRYVMGGWKTVEGCAAVDKQELRVRKTTLHYDVDVLSEECDTATTVYYMVSLPLGYAKYETEINVQVSDL